MQVHEHLLATPQPPACCADLMQLCRNIEAASTETAEDLVVMQIYPDLRDTPSDTPASKRSKSSEPQSTSSVESGGARSSGKRSRDGQAVEQPPPSQTQPAAVTLEVEDDGGAQSAVEQSLEYKVAVADVCASCLDGGQLYLCSLCNKGYHLPCLNKDVKPKDKLKASELACGMQQLLPFSAVVLAGDIGDDWLCMPCKELVASRVIAELERLQREKPPAPPAPPPLPPEPVVQLAACLLCTKGVEPDADSASCDTCNQLVHLSCLNAKSSKKRGKKSKAPEPPAEPFRCTRPHPTASVVGHHMGLCACKVCWLHDEGGGDGGVGVG